MAASALYICDLDGTLLRSDGALSEFARDGLNKLLGAGVRLTVASSRATPAMRALLAGVDLRLPVIEFNGAFISELQSGRHLASNVLSPSAACAAVEAILATGADPVVSTWDGSHDRVHFGDRLNEGTSWYVEEKRAYGDPRLRPCDDLLEAAGGRRWPRSSGLCRMPRRRGWASVFAKRWAAKRSSTAPRTTTAPVGPRCRFSIAQRHSCEVARISAWKQIRWLTGLQASKIEPGRSQSVGAQRYSPHPSSFCSRNLLSAQRASSLRARRRRGPGPVRTRSHWRSRPPCHDLLPSPRSTCHERRSFCRLAPVRPRFRRGTSRPRS